MATEFVLRQPVSRGSKKTKSIIVIAAIFLTFIVGSSVFVTLNTLSTGLSSSATKQAICTAKVLELARQGAIREVKLLWRNIRMYSHAWF